MSRFGVVVLLLLPVTASADVFISEIAWMGSVESPNHEWIELYNAGETTVVDRWHIRDGNNLSIELAGSIPADSYAVLERTSDASAPGAAWSIYTGALINTGATLTLVDDSNTVVDRVVGGENWESIGGNNETKDTAQLRNGTWVTAPATPGRAASQAAPTESAAAPAQKNSSNTSAALATPARTNKPVEPMILPDIDLTLVVEGPATGYINQPVTLGVDADGIGPTWINSLSYTWNFGDGHIKSGELATHAFAHPGTYVVTVFGEYKRHSALGRFEITILPVTLSLAKSDNGKLLLHNDAPYEVDISGYRVISADGSFTFPDYSYLLDRQSILVPGLSTAQAELADNTGSILARLDAFESAIATPTLTTVPEASQSPVTTTRAEPQPLTTAEVAETTTTRFGFTTTNSATTALTTAVTSTIATVEPVPIDETDVSRIYAPATQTAAVTQTERSLQDWWMAALIVLLMISIIAIYIRPTHS